jgi:steroid delta-isomerase-like uncharacterized protein
MVAQENLDLARQLIDCFNKNDPNTLDQFDALIDKNVQYHDLASQGKTKNLQAFKQAEQKYVKAFPNKKTQIDGIVSADDNQVIVRWTTRGTHKATFYGVPPTNQQITISGITIWRFSNKKLIEAWQLWDRLGLLEQIGAIHAAH